MRTKKPNLTKPEKAIGHGCQNLLHLENHVLNSFQDYTAQYSRIIARFGMKIQSLKYQYFGVNGRLNPNWKNIEKISQSFGRKSFDGHFDYFLNLLRDS